MKRKPSTYPLPSVEPIVLRETPAAVTEGLVINIRAAKDQLSSLVEQAAHGNEVIITSDGKPKAKLVPLRRKKPVFRVDWDLLNSRPMSKDAARAEKIVREDRDGRA